MDLFPELPILIVDDEEEALKSLRIVLELNQINNIICCEDSQKVIPLIKDQEISVVILDLSMPVVSGEELLIQIKNDFPQIQVIIVTGINEIKTAVKCIREGAFDYLVKPIEAENIISSLKRVFEFRDLKQENMILRERFFSHKLESPQTFSNIITKNKDMFAVFQYVEAVASSRQPVLISGETGVGKELIARAIHDLSGDKGEFVAVNVAGLDDTVFSDTLFGHTKGAFTGADKERKGLIEQAQGGTLLLDEIGDLTLASQVKLLRLVQEWEYFPLGSDVKKNAKTRIIVATNQNLYEEQAVGKFRKDLLYRLRTHYIEVPSLRKRKNDIPLLIDHFLKEVALELKTKIPHLPNELLTILCQYDYPGNVRELKSMIFNAVSENKSGKLSINNFKVILEQKKNLTNEFEDTAEGEEGFLFKGKIPTIKAMEKILVNEAMKTCSGNQTAAAKVLGITRQTLSKYLKEM